MTQRKRIGVIAAYPEGIYCQRAFEGILAQCKSYGWDALIFAQSSNICDRFKDYLYGEKKIYELINYENLDGVILLPLMFNEDGKNIIFEEQVMKRLRAECKAPVISLDIRLDDDIPVVITDDRAVFRELARHVVVDHGRRDVVFLAGVEGAPSTEIRLAGFLDEMEANGIPVDESRIVYGDFWYPSGIALADRIADGEFGNPNAVICASDHMAIGLANRLAERGISVPEQIIVTGFDSTQEAAVNGISITTAVPSVDSTGAKAVDMIRAVLEPDSEIAPYAPSLSERLSRCESCGCNGDHAFWKTRFKSTQYYTSYTFDSADFRKRGNITLLMESHMLERLSAAYSPQECIEEIYHATYLIRPYSNFYLCLREDWLNAGGESDSYPERMKKVVHTTPEVGSGFCDINGQVFDAGLMLPDLTEPREEPSVYLFSPVHFNEEMFGYAVLQTDFESFSEQNLLVYRNWLRNVNCALEIARARNRLLSLSISDAMTGMLNRRGMKHNLKRMLKSAAPEDAVLVYVIDMDGLKTINDTFGHTEGDFGIVSISSAVKSIAREGELCVRAGGDEFYLIGVGQYSAAEENDRVVRLIRLIDTAGKAANKPYPLSASIGFRIGRAADVHEVAKLIDEADTRMYENKTARKVQRN